MIKAHKIRLNPTLEQEAYFFRASGVARFAWNWALEEYKRRKAASEEVDWNEIKSCGTEHDRDENGVINIEMEGVRLLVGSGSLDVTTVEFAASGLKLVSI